MKYSATQLSMFAQCPAQYESAYLTSGENKGIREPGAAAEAGNVVHRALHLAALKRIGMPVKEPVTKKELLDLATTALQEPKKDWKEPPILTTEIAQRASAIINECWKKITFAHTVMAEEKFDVSLGPIGGPDGERVEEGLNLTGVIDRVDEEKNEITIIDYKTGYEVLSTNDAELDPQVNLYLVAARRKFPNKEIGFELHYLSRGIKIGPIRWTPEREEWATAFIRALAWRIKKWKSFREVPNTYCSNCFRQSECKAYKRMLKGSLNPLSRDIGTNMAEYRRLTEIEKSVDGAKKLLKQVIHKAIDGAEDGEVIANNHRARSFWTPRTSYSNLKRTTEAATKEIWAAEVQGKIASPSLSIPTDPAELAKAHAEALRKIALLEEATKKSQLALQIAYSIGQPQQGLVDKFVDNLPKAVGVKVASVVEGTSDKGGFPRLEVEELTDPFPSMEQPPAEPQETAAA